MSAPHEKARFLWIGSKLSPIEQLALRSFVAHGWDVQLYLYGPCEGVPAGVSIRNAGEVIAEKAIFSDDKSVPNSSYANFSDLFRWRLLAESPGWWFDMDMISISPPNEDDRGRIRFGSTWEGEFGQCAIPCVMLSDGRHPIFQTAFAKALNVVESKRHREFNDIGPFLLQDLIRELGLDDRIAPWWEFCPFPWRQIKAACSSNLTAHLLDRARIVKHTVWELGGAFIRPAYVRSDTRAVHLHNEIWRRAGLSKTGPFFRRSFVARQLLKYEIEGATIV